MREIAQKLSRCSSFGALMDDAFARCPEREAIVYEDWRLTYGDLERYIHQTAHYLRHLGVRKGSRVAILSRNCPEWIIAEFALYQLGAIVVKINWRLTPPEQARMLARNQVSVAFLKAEKPEWGAELERLCADSVRLIRLEPVDGRSALCALVSGEPDTPPDAPVSVAVTAFLTGVTEPLEFLFMFLAPLLYLLHALLTGISLFVATLLGIHAGFSFSAGAIDYALMYNLPAASQNVWMLLVMGVIFFAIYFVVFSLVIRMFNLKTPGREDKEDEIVTEEANSNTEEGLTQLATNYIAAVGGTDNLKAIDACITRLRLTVADSARVNDTMCKRLGASGVVKLNKQTIQVIVGAKAESIGDAMKKVVARGPVAAASAEATPATAAPVAKPQAVPNAVSIAELVSPITGDVVALDQVPDEAFASKAVGDGVAVKPTDKIVVSPAAGTIVKIFNTNHAFCLETEKGAEIVVHMGIDTVALEGKGFKRLVEEGAQVSAGQPILEMDLDYLNANARSMISPVVCSNIDDFSGLIIKAQGHVVAGQTPLYEIKK